MIWLSGHKHPQLARLREDVGYILTPTIGQSPEHGTWWAADTGCFTEKVPFSLERYLGSLEKWQPWRYRCLFATAPDVVGDYEATWQRSKAVLPQLRAIGYRAALVAQDGLEAPDWDAFDVLFVGGTTAWKLSEDAYRLAAEAQRRGKWLHMGRVNSLKRLNAARIGLFDSADGTKLAWGPDTNLPLVLRWLDAMKGQPTLGLGLEVR